MAVLILTAGMIFVVCIVALAIAFFIWNNNKKSNTVTVSKDGSIPANAGPLTDEIPAVLATIKGEKAAEIVASGYFSKVYPGVTVVTKPTALPSNTPSFQLLTDATGTITGVKANTVLWNSDDTAPVPTKRPTK